ncbi:hypothetical protein AHMF7605_21230 [Adhaeribacter arboris]|uniref:Transcriptional regulator n=1 Tax=Adhaeribacter arboris TaxID=2072846 RepID=A0A2T2YK04_9BACT|nr:two-component regulator propeller domain-containing protein [Adhaeribacter arboris]PSR55841.1 hypothetical protein AHMF7605_21230 [Adhaeribacter arboris]
MLFLGWAYPLFINRTLTFFLSFTGWLLTLAAPVNGQVNPRLKSTYYSLPDPAVPVALFNTAKNKFLIAQKGIYQQAGKTLVTRYTASAIITCALEEDSAFWLGTQKGLQRVNKKTFSAVPITLPLSETQPLITTIVKDSMGQIWVGAEAYGVFKLTDTGFEKVLGAFPVNAGAATGENSVWIGTNTGLYRWKDKQWIRYNEEGVTNFEIPDNIVTSLYTDNNNNLWVIMPEGVAVLETKPHAKERSEHIPAVKFIGKPQNAIYSVSYLKQQGYVFATGLGLLFLPESHSDALTGLEQSSTTDIVENKQILHSITLPHTNIDFSQSVIFQSDTKNNYWLVDKQGISVFSVKQFSQLLKKSKAISTEISKIPFSPK